MLNGLDTTAKFVDDLPAVDEDMIILAGYTPTKIGDSKSVTPDAPEMDKIDRGAKGVLEPACKAVTGASFYGCIVLDQPYQADFFSFVDGQMIIGKPSGLILMIVTKGRRKTVAGLKSGTEYWFYFYAGNIITAMAFRKIRTTKFHHFPGRIFYHLITLNNISAF